MASYNVVPDQVASAPTEKPGFLNPRTKTRNRVFYQCHSECCEESQTFNLAEKPGFLNPRTKTRNRVFYQCHSECCEESQTFNLAEKPGFLNPRARIRNRVFAKIFGSNLRFCGKTRFL